MIAGWQAQAKPIAAALTKLRGVHPRLYLDNRRIAELRGTIHTTGAATWKRVLRQADREIRRGPPKYVLDDGHSGEEQLWQRTVGDAMPFLAIAYVLGGDRQYLAAAHQWALASCRYPTWGLGNIDGMDLAAGHQLFGLAIVYDWCYADLDETARREIRETLRRRGEAMFEAAATGRNNRPWWRKSYLQNHLWVNGCGLVAAGLATFDEIDEANAWIAMMLDKFQRSIKALGPDGASHEGVGYWEYGTESLLKFMDLARADLGVDLYDVPWWHKTAAYPQYLMLPRNAWSRRNCLVDLADCPRGNWYGPDYQLHALADEFHDGHAQWLADATEKSGVAAPTACWLNLIWRDRRIAAQSPTDLPTLRHFQDMGIVSARSDWSGNESLVVFKCGPYVGHGATAAFDYDPGAGHVHPDANHFVVFGDGQWLIRAAGYFGKRTGRENTLLIDDRGQLGEGRMWFDPSEILKHKVYPKILRVASTPVFDAMSGDATEAYSPKVGLRRFVRHLVFLKPDVLIVADDIEMNHDAALELRFHPERPMRREANGFISSAAPNCGWKP